MISFSDLLHPDSVVGLIADVMQQAAHPASNTLADLAVYRGLPLETLFPAPMAMPAVEVRPRWSAPGIVSEDLVFASSYEPLEPRFRERYVSDYRETHTVYARRIRPATAEQRPRVLYLHGYLQPETYVEELALLVGMALRLNVEIIQVQSPYHGRRTPRGSRFGGELFWTADLVRSVEALRQGLFDVRTLLTWLLASDPRPVGIVGLSMGGVLSLILTCLDARLAFSVPMIAHMDPCALLADAPVLGRMRHELRAFGWGPSEMSEFAAQIGWSTLLPRLPPERIHLFAASDDRFFSPAVVEDMWARWGRPAIRWYPCSHMGFLPRLPEVVGAVREFIDRQS